MKSMTSIPSIWPFSITTSPCLVLSGRIWHYLNIIPFFWSDYRRQILNGRIHLSISLLFMPLFFSPTTYKSFFHLSHAKRPFDFSDAVSLVQQQNTKRIRKTKNTSDCRLKNRIAKKIENRKAKLAAIIPDYYRFKALLVA